MTNEEIIKELTKEISITLPVGDWMCVSGALKSHPISGEFAKGIVGLIRSYITERQQEAHEQAVENSEVMDRLADQSKARLEQENFK